mmetsp:Transcript_120285/g.256741  ORF Transcript_120285/g.256741 Transcript_120285/m.256741 type:complete len:252 (+) Transcript_120285:113-868(+)
MRSLSHASCWAALSRISFSTCTAWRDAAFCGSLIGTFVGSGGAPVAVRFPAAVAKAARTSAAILLRSAPWSSAAATTAKAAFLSCNKAASKSPPSSAFAKAFSSSWPVPVEPSSARRERAQRSRSSVMVAATTCVMPAGATPAEGTAASPLCDAMAPRSCCTFCCKASNSASLAAAFSRELASSLRASESSASVSARRRRRSSISCCFSATSSRTIATWMLFSSLLSASICRRCWISVRSSSSCCARTIGT